MRINRVITAREKMIQQFHLNPFRRPYVFQSRTRRKGSGYGRVCPIGIIYLDCSHSDSSAHRSAGQCHLCGHSSRSNLIVIWMASAQQVMTYSKFKAIFQDERGQDLIEYGLLGSFISISAIAVLRIIGAPVLAMFQRLLAELLWMIQCSMLKEPWYRR